MMNPHHSQFNHEDGGSIFLRTVCIPQQAITQKTTVCRLSTVTIAKLLLKNRLQSKGKRNLEYI
jgi:hypothetical protein